MTFHRLAEYFSELEATTLRNSMVEILARLFAEVDIGDIGNLSYLLQGRVAPLYEPLEFGVADKMMIRAIARVLDCPEESVLSTFKKEGDLGKAVEKLKAVSGKQSALSSMSVHTVYTELHTLALTTGAESQKKKSVILADLLTKADPQAANYIVRITLGKLRLGFSDATILEGLSWMLGGDKSQKKTIEEAYNVRPDLGYIAHAVKAHGMQGIAHVSPAIGTPILMARANRLSSSAEIIEKIGQCAVEYKYDGLRLQVHYRRHSERSEESRRKQNDRTGSFPFDSAQGQDDTSIRMFSRNLEDVTVMFPDIAAALETQINADEVIFEGEVVAFNPQTGVFVPFQETMQRKRKYGIEEKAAEIPVKLFAFELLYCDGENYITQPYEKRKKQLKKVIGFSRHSEERSDEESRPDPSLLFRMTGDTIIYAQEIIAQSEDDVEDMFADSVKKHFEGIIAKRLDGVYEAGARGWNWIKYKKAMNKKLSDTIDVVVMGYTLGEGKRTAFGVGQFLTGVYDEKQDRFVTISKVGTGLTDNQFREFITRVKSLHVKEQPANYDVEKLLVPDVWVSPSLVVEVSCDEITRSAVHTAGRVMEPSKSGKALSVKIAGFALRFPRLERFRDDKRATDASTVSEVEKMYQAQKGD